MSIEMMLMAAIGLLIGIGIGFFVGRSSMAKEAEQKAEIESELWQTKREVEEYRHQVNNHFERTAELIGGLTDSYKEMTQRYKAVYEHLAQGAQTLASREVGKKLAASTIDQLIYEANEEIHVAEKSARLPATQRSAKKEGPPPPQSEPTKSTKKETASGEQKKKKPTESRKGEKAGSPEGKQPKEGKDEKADKPQEKRVKESKTVSTSDEAKTRQNVDSGDAGKQKSGEA